MKTFRRRKYGHGDVIIYTKENGRVFHLDRYIFADPWGMAGRLLEVLNQRCEGCLGNGKRLSKPPGEILRTNCLTGNCKP